MRGEFICVWSETWREIWLPLIEHEGVPEDIFCELYRSLAPALKDKPSVEAQAIPPRFGNAGRTRHPTATDH